MAAGDIEKGRSGSWSDQAIGKLNPGQDGVNFVISGPVHSDLQVSGSSTYSVDPNQEYYIVGLGLRKDSGYAETMMTCKEIRIPFKTSPSSSVVMSTLKINYRTSYPNWIYVWADSTESAAKFYGSWVSPGSGSGVDIYNEYEAPTKPDLDYEMGIPGPGGIIFIPYIHPNYLTTDDYNGILGNVMETAETDHLYTILQKDVEDKFKNKVKNLRYKNYLEDYHKYNAVGGLHAGELNIPGGNLSRCMEEKEYFLSWEKRANELSPGSMVLQTLDFPYMSYRAISASVYVDQFTEQFNASGSPIPRPLYQVWEDMQGGNVDDPETIYFIGKADKEGDESLQNPPKVSLDRRRTTIPVEDSILFRMDGHLAVRVTKATVYAPFLNTVYRTGEYGEVIELFTSQSTEP